MPPLSPKNQSLTKELLLLLTHWLSTSSFHGLSQIGATQKSLTRRLIWLLLFIVSASYCIFNLYELFLEFTKYPTVTNTETISDFPVVFPSVTICILSNKTVPQMILKSEYARKVLSPDEITLTHAYVDERDETCFTFNKNGSKIAYSVEQNFEIELFLGIEDNTSFPNGAHVIIHNASGYKPYSEGFDISTGNLYFKSHTVQAIFFILKKIFLGVFTSVVFSKVVRQEKPAPYSECLDADSEQYLENIYKGYADLIKLHNKEYSSSECSLICVADIIKTCPICFDRLAECRLQCRPGCKTVTFSYMLGFSNFPQRNYFEVNRNFTGEFQNNHSFATLKQSVLKLSMRYDQMGYTLVQKIPKYTFDSLIGTFGGTFGCFIGASLLSLVELLLLVLDVIMLACRKMDKKMDKKLTVVETRNELKQII